MLYFALAALVCAPVCAHPSTPVILISVDTLRADHLSCYQTGRRPTPHIDALAKNGTLFSQISSPFPLTLPSHVALFTSTYPFANRVEDNGVPLAPSAVTLATVLKSAGYKTGAFVGSFVLDRRFGLNRGFDVYDGPLDVHNKTSYGAIERKRPGGEVAGAAMHWLERNSSEPFFVFLHLYDLHLPYDRPQDPSLRHGETGYEAELEYEDRVVGDFLAFLDHRQLLKKTLIVFTSDHGEGLGEHGESTHGYFIYQSTLHVPLIIQWPTGSKRPPQNRIDGPASLLDVAPTILDAVGVARPPEMQGRSLIAGDVAREIYSESVYARNHFGCAVLRSLRAGDYKYIDAPKPELYDLSKDPKEERNLYDQQKPRAAALHKRIVAVRSSFPSGRASNPPMATPETVKILRSLGYLSGSSSSSLRESQVDPKDRIVDFERYFSALSLAAAGKLAESDTTLRNLRDKLPDVEDIKLSVAFNLERRGENEQAAHEFKRVIEQDPSNASAHFELGSCYFRLRQYTDAIRQFEAALALQPWFTRADEAVAEIYIQEKAYTQARAHLNHILSIDPTSYTANYNLGIMAAMAKNWSEAEQRMLRALHADPGSAEAHTTLGSLYLQRGALERASHEFQEAIRLQPNFAAAHYNLGLVYQKQGKTEEAGREFRAAQESDRSAGQGR